MTWVNDQSETRQRTPTEKALHMEYQRKWAREREQMRKRNAGYVRLQDIRRTLDLLERGA